jgi:hypothetical protein
MNEYHLDPDRYGLNDEQQDNSIAEQAFNYVDSLHELYRLTYKYTACGPWLSALIEYHETIEPDGFNDYPSEKLVSRWVHCGELHTLGTWKTMQERGILLRSLMVGSIVEGVDQCTDNYEVPCQPDRLENDELPEDGGDLANTLKRMFDRAVEAVDIEAESIWHETHGCDTCAKHWGKEEGCDGDTNIWLDCPECHGHGAII